MKIFVQQAIEIVKNAVSNLSKVFRRYVRLPDYLIRKKIAGRIMKKELEGFETDYIKFYIEGESKGADIGRPSFINRRFSNKGLLLIHGYMAAPEEVKGLAEGTLAAL